MTTTMFDSRQLADMFFSQTANTPHLGDQTLAFIKITIYALVFVKVFQLTFLKYSRKLAIEDRIEQKYRYCHGELIEDYSEDETKLMHTTITNTIHNTEIKTPKRSPRSRLIKKQVSFNTDKNVYHNFKNQPEDSEDSNSQESLSSRKQLCFPAEKENQENNNKTRKTTSLEVQTLPECSDINLELNSKITQETETSSLATISRAISTVQSQKQITVGSNQD